VVLRLAVVVLLDERVVACAMRCSIAARISDSTLDSFP
jgi:hypothetical protein